MSGSLMLDPLVLVNSLHDPMGRLHMETRVQVCVSRPGRSVHVLISSGIKIQCGESGHGYWRCIRSGFWRCLENKLV
jgi:hypothetical protein